MIDGDLGDLAAIAHRADASYRSELQQAAQRVSCIWLTTLCGRQVRVDRKLRLWLVANGRWTELDQLIQQVLLYGAIPMTVVQRRPAVRGRRALPGGRRRAPASTWNWGRARLRFRDASNMSLGMINQLEVHGWAFIRGLDLSSETPRAHGRACRAGNRLLAPVRR